MVTITFTKIAKKEMTIVTSKDIMGAYRLRSAMRLNRCEQPKWNNILGGWVLEDEVYKEFIESIKTTIKTMGYKVIEVFDTRLSEAGGSHLKESTPEIEKISKSSLDPKKVKLTIQIPTEEEVAKVIQEESQWFIGNSSGEYDRANALSECSETSYKEWSWEEASRESILEITP